MEMRFSIDAEDGMLIEWPDGHQTRYSLAELRSFCPCATCRDQQGAGAGEMLPAADPAATTLLSIESVGRYAICPIWGDGHATGIYSYDLLRERCGCLACRLARGKAGSLGVRRSDEGGAMKEG